eukprot:EG_transcript_11056
MACKKAEVLGLRHESKSEHEHRVPLIPNDVKEIIASSNVKVLIQPSPTRCISVEPFVGIGAKIEQDFSSCDLIMGIKEVPKEELLPQKSYLFFSHVIKGQPYNMPLLKKLMDLGCNLFDYEKMTNDKGARLVAFGKQAGQCGTINAFHSLNRRLSELGHRNPFERCKQAKDYRNFAEAKADLKLVGEDILQHGLPDALPPFVIAVTGKGNVASGVFDILSAIPCIVDWTVDEMTENLQAGRFDFNHIYKVVLDAGDLYELKENPNPAAFTFADMNANPDAYVSTVPKHLMHFSMFINAVFWKEEFPKYITKDVLKDLWQKNQLRLIVIADITCDIEGSVEVTVKSTLPNNPSYVYHPVTGEVEDGFVGEGVVIMAVDILPAEQPYESSVAFSTVLSPFMPSLLAADFSVPFDALQLDPVWKRACIVYHGELTPAYQYLHEHLQKAAHDAPEPVDATGATLVSAIPAGHP